MSNQYTAALTKEVAQAHFRACVQAFRDGATRPGEHVQGTTRRAAHALAGERLGLPRGSWVNRYSACVRIMGREPDWTGSLDLEKPRVKVRAASAEPRPQAPIEPPAVDRDRVRLEDEVIRLRKELKTAVRHDLSAESIRAEIFGLAAQPPSPPTWLIEDKPATSGPGVPSTIWSDWHWNEVVRAEEVGGVNEYNNAIAHARARRLTERVIDLCFNHMVNPTYPGIVVNLGGDMISGDIHEELAQTNEATTMATVIDLQDVLAASITALADRFGKVFLPCVVGNHGRSTHKPRAKGRVHTSYEWLMYQSLERHFRNDPRVTFFIPGETDAHYRVYGHRYMLTHGDSLGVKGGDGIIGALGPIMRGMIKTSRSEAQIGREFDTILLGHWHQLLHLPGGIVNGSLKGFDEYARLYLRARAEPPQQALWWTHPVRGPTFHTAVQVEDHKAVAAPWLEWRSAA